VQKDITILARRTVAFWAAEVFSSVTILEYFGFTEVEMRPLRVFARSVHSLFCWLF
jgi:hypothetical protein